MVAVAPNCFLCTGQIPPNFLQNSDENSLLLCEFLEIPHLVNNGGIRYCPACADRILGIRDKFEELERLEKKILDEKHLIENQLKGNSRKPNDERQAEENCSTDEMRIRIGGQLTVKTIQLMLKKIREKQVGRTVNTQRPVRIMKNVKITKTPTLQKGRNCQNSGGPVQTQLPASGRKCDTFACQGSPIIYHESLPLENNLEVQSNSGAGVLEDPLQINTCEAGWTVSDFDVDIDIKHEKNSYVMDVCDDIHVDNLVAASEFTPGTSTESASNFVKSEFVEGFGETKFTDSQRTDEGVGNTKTYICGVCRASFDRYNLLLIHDRVHMKPGSKSAVPMSRKTDAISSKNEHTSSKNRRLKQNCPSTGPKKFDEQIRNLKVPPSLRPKKCDECGRILSSVKGWKLHVMRVHRKEHKFKCTLCDFGCQRKGDLEDHKFIHSDVKNFKCHVCHNAFKQKTNLYKHLRLHH